MRIFEVDVRELERMVRIFGWDVKQIREGVRFLDVVV